MWETPFDLSMLNKDVIISCPTKELSSELLELLSQHRIHRIIDDAWSGRKESTCYRVSGHAINYGSKEHYERNQGSYSGYTYCTFYGVDTPDFDTASDDELCSLFGI